MKKTTMYKKKQQQPEKQKVCRLSNLDISEFLVHNNINANTELLAKLCEQKDDGKKDLSNLLLLHYPISLKALLITTWKTQVSATILCSKTTHMELIRKHVNSSTCIDGYDSQCLQRAQEVL